MGKRRPSSATTSSDNRSHSSNEPILPTIERGKHITFDLNDNDDPALLASDEEQNIALSGLGTSQTGAPLLENEEDDEAPPEESLKSISNKASKESQQLLRRTLEKQQQAEKAKRRDRQERLNLKKRSNDGINANVTEIPSLLSEKARMLPEEVIHDFITNTSTSANGALDNECQKLKKTRIKYDEPIKVKNVMIVKSQSEFLSSSSAGDASVKRQRHLFNHDRLKRVPAIMNIGRRTNTPALHFGLSVLSRPL